MIETLLKDMGLREQEIRIYLLLLESGPFVAGQLAKRTATPRASLYGFLDRLVEKGFVSQSVTPSGIKQFDAEPPTKMLFLVDEQLEHLKKQREGLYEALIKKQTDRSKRSIKPSFQVFHGKEGVKNILKDLLLYSDIDSESFWPVEIMTETLSPELFAHFNRQRIRNNFRLRVLWPSSQRPDVGRYPFLGTGERFKREIRLAPKGVDCSMGYWIYGSRVAFVSSYQEAMGFIIESRELAELLKTSFEFIWRLSKPLTLTKKEKDATNRFLEDLKRP